MGQHKNKKEKLWKEGEKTLDQVAISFVVVFVIQKILDIVKYRGWPTITIPSESFPSNDDLSTTVNLGILLFILPCMIFTQFNFKIATKKQKNRVIGILFFFALVFVYTLYDVFVKVIF
ncbi:hypothetical protein [Candidatus Enterococcus mansonii]|uniref:Uncharacterized protein n=1 Tax=Candidatus Enterococcus mansonii TaxID=1834181 RepID=A0A242CH34_9ENTE|nr:hypothetical protein [Enterococcus sp. 4G2_DIV0659]OTO09521.1 hypothetical protein A5880_000200 [Enterococcus sp. 4G2_DIV0659]